ncbi:MAG: YajQ family cyclic di-GMP-binding protein [Chitinophagaceae bacterium]|nr:YajQ family cyclic di-GMP-binding protein [Oligoflexus sp.]
MASFDIASEVDLQEVDNAVNQTSKEVESRFDFRGGKSSVELDKAEKLIKIVADDELKLRSIHQLLEQKFVKRGIDLRWLDYGKEETGGGNLIKQKVTLKNGVGKEDAKKITKVIKDSGLKVQAAIQDDQVRVTAKKIDDLQGVIQLLRGNSEIGIPLQFLNMRS